MRMAPSHPVRLTLISSILFSSCLAPTKTTYTTTHYPDAAAPPPASDRLWEETLETLRRHRFKLDRVDRATGTVTTLPTTSQHYFELWRHDVNTWPDFWEASLNTTRRWVEVRIAARDDGAVESICVIVHKELLSSPDRQFNNTVAGYQLFGDSLPSTTGAPKVTAEDDRWLDRGRDGAMEEYLLQTILTRAGVEQYSEVNAPSSQRPAAHQHLSPAGGLDRSRADDSAGADAAPGN